MAAAEAKAYRVIGAAAVVRKDKHERYLYRGAVFSADAIDADNAKHLVGLKLIEAYSEPTGDGEAAGSGSGGSSGGGDKGSGSGSGS